MSGNAFITIRYVASRTSLRNTVVTLPDGVKSERALLSPALFVANQNAKGAGVPESGKFFCCYSAPGKNHEVKDVDRHFFENSPGVPMRFAPTGTGVSLSVKLRRLGMPFDWNLYDHYFRDPKRTQQPIGKETRLSLEAESANLLKLSPEERRGVWGECTIPGCYGMVIRLPSELRHRWNSGGDRAVGFKVFHPHGFGKSARELVPFHTKVRRGYPGLPNPQVQQVFDGGQFENALPGEAAPRWYLIQEWIEGETWDAVLERGTLDGEQGRALIVSLFEGIIFPLWSQGVIWWDIRSNNYCVRESPKGMEVVMIDTDSLAAYSDEIVNTPGCHLKRDAKKLTGVRRLNTMIQGLSDAVLRNRGPKGRISKDVRKQAEEMKQTLLETLARPGPLQCEAARTKLERMVTYFQESLWSG